MPDETPMTVPWVLVIWWKSPLDRFSGGGKGVRRNEQRVGKINKQEMKKMHKKKNRTPTLKNIFKNPN